MGKTERRIPRQPRRVDARREPARRGRYSAGETTLQKLGPKETGAVADETGFTLHLRLGRGWGKHGERLRVPTMSQHRTQLHLGEGVAPLLGRSGVLRLPRGDRTGFRHMLQPLYRRLRGYTIWLHVDGVGWHKGDAVGAFLRTHPHLRLNDLPR
jgi:hypothetical protein